MKRMQMKNLGKDWCVPTDICTSYVLHIHTKLLTQPFWYCKLNWFIQH